MISRLDTIVLRLFICCLLFPLACYAQDWKYQQNHWNKRSDNINILKGVASGFVFFGQTTYPDSYHGPEINGLFNDGAYGFYIDVYLKKFIIGIQLSDEYYFIAYEDDNGQIWKPRGFNGSFSSRTRSIWLTTGYAIWDPLYIKINAGVRTGPADAIIFKNTNPEWVASGFDFDDPFNYYNRNTNELPNFSELDFSFSINYPFTLFSQFSILPEIGYAINYGSFMMGLGVKYNIQSDAN